MSRTKQNPNVTKRIYYAYHLSYHGKFEFPGEGGDGGREGDGGLEGRRIAITAPLMRSVGAFQVYIIILAEIMGQGVQYDKEKLLANLLAPSHPPDGLLPPHHTGTMVNYYRAVHILIQVPCACVRIAYRYLYR